jgi:hypothetical protein
MTEQEEVAELRTRLGWPRGRQIAPAELPAVIEQLARVAERRGAEQLAEVARAAVRDPDSPDRLYDLGYTLIDAGAPAMAASVLWRCLALVGDSEEVVCELVSALECALAYEDAFAILEQQHVLRARSFLCQYLYAFDAAMTGRLDVTRTALAQLVADSPETETMRGTITAICARADRVAGTTALDHRDLRGWHYVLTGGLLLHQSPFGFEDAMRGRYAWLHDSLARVAFGIERLVPLVRELRLPCVYAPPGVGHEIVARAIAARLELPLAPWPAVGVPAPGLVAMYDLSDLPATELPKLLHRREGQILYAHASPWTRDSPVAPDATTLLYQMLEPPWQDGDDPAALATAITSGPHSALDQLAEDEPARWAALAARAWPPPAPDTRARLWAGGPVPSNRFD